MYERGAVIKMFEKDFSFIDAEVIGNEFFFSSRTINAIYKYDFECGKLVFATSDEKYKLRDRMLHRKIVRNGNTLFFIPLYADRILVYDYGKSKKNYIELPENKKNLLGNIKYTNACKLQNGCLLIPYELDGGIDFLDFDKEEVTSCKRINEKISDILGDNKKKPHIKYHASDETDEQVYLITDYGVLFSVSKENNTVEKCLALNQKTGAIKYVNNKVWILLPDTCSLCCWDSRKKTIKNYHIPLVCTKDIVENNLFMFSLSDTVCLEVNNDNIFLQYDEEKDDFVTARFVDNLYKLGFDASDDGIPFWSYKKLGQAIWLFPRDSNGMVIIEESTQQVKLIRTDGTEFLKELEKQNVKLEQEYYDDWLKETGIIGDGEQIGNTGNKYELEGFLRVLLND